MKTMIAALLAAALTLPAAAQAQPQQQRPSYAQRDRSDRDAHRHQAAPSRQQQTHRFAQGQRFDRSRANNYRRLDHRQNRKLSAPGRDQVWVRAGDDALLVSLRNNVVQRVVPNVF